MTAAFEGLERTMQQAFTYHDVSSDPTRDIYSVTPDKLFQHLATMTDQTHKRPGAPLITFDGGHRSNLCLAVPIIDAFSIKAHFFLTTDWISTHSDCMDWTEVRSLAKAGHSIGSHTAKGAVLTDCTPAALERELIGSRKRLEDHLGQPVKCISLPGGKWNEAVLRGCALADYEVVYISEPGYFRPPSLSSDLITPTVIGRLTVRDQTSLRRIAAYASGQAAAVQLLQAAYYVEHGIRSVFGENAYQRLSSYRSRASSN